MAGGAHRLGEFHPLTPEVVLQEPERRSVRAEPGPADPGPLCVAAVASVASWVPPRSSWGGFSTSRERPSPPHWFCIFKRRPWPAGFWADSRGKRPRPPGGPGRGEWGGPQRRVARRVTGLHLGGVILTSLGAHGCSAVGVKLKKRCWLVSEAGKDGGGWPEAGRGASVGLCHPNTVEGRDRSADHRGHCLSYFLNTINFHNSIVIDIKGSA